MAKYNNTTEGLTLVHDFAEQVRGRTCKNNHYFSHGQMKPDQNSSLDWT